jgi:hypothetical protein
MFAESVTQYIALGVLVFTTIWMLVILTYCIWEAWQ